MDVSILYTRIRTGLDRIPPLFFFFCSHIIGQGKTKEEDGREAAMESRIGYLSLSNVKQPALL